MHKLTLTALVIIASSAAASGALAQDAAKGDPAAGKTSFNKCLACHSIGEGAKNKVGPELNGIDGRKSGSALLLGLAIPVMHYVGMEAVTFLPAPLPAAGIAHAFGISQLRGFRRKPL